MKKLRGCLDTCDKTGIKGWIIDEDFPNDPVDLDVFVDNELIAKISANIFREDLLIAGLGNGYCSFDLPMPNKFFDFLEHKLDIKESSSQILYSDFSKIFVLSNIKKRFFGYLDTCDEKGIRGWVIDENNHGVNVELDVFIDKKLVKTIIANDFRQDLLEAGFNYGCCAFHIYIPYEFFDGQLHEIEFKSKNNESVFNYAKRFECSLLNLDIEYRKNYYEKLSKSEKINIIKNSNLLDKDWYIKKLNNFLYDDFDILEHYCEFGIGEDIPPNAYFDFDWYKTLYANNLSDSIDILTHYIIIGCTEKYSPSPLFDINVYVKLIYLDNTNIDPLAHFLIHNNEIKTRLAINKNSYIYQKYEIIKSELFLDKWYLACYPDLANENDPITHYILFGEKENRKPNPYFDPSWYRYSYMEGLSQESALLHYIREGWKLGNDPSAIFNIETYRNSYAIDLGITEEPLCHYLKFGASWLGGEHCYDLVKTDFYISIPKKLEKKDERIDQIKALISEPLWRIFEWMIADKNNDTKNLLDNTYNARKLKIDWVIPDFTPGGGGHTTIFRIIKLLDLKGHQQKIWIDTSHPLRNDKESLEMIFKNFQIIRASVSYINESSLFNNSHGDIVFATSYDTVFSVMTLKKFKRHFYFVQDYESLFHPMGANYLAAELTYKQDIDCICASPWLEKKMSNFGRWAKIFWLAADKNIYFPSKNKNFNKIPRIVFYARRYTARRVVEFGLMALLELNRRGIIFHVDLINGNCLENTYVLPFSNISYDILTQEQLGDLYRKADIGIVFSATNYSLVPQEMMCCGLPVVELDGESTRAIFPSTVVTFAEPEPKKIADAIYHLISDADYRGLQIEKANEWVSQFSWEKSADMIEEAILERLNELKYTKITDKINTLPKASIVIPTYNGAKEIENLLRKLEVQRTPWPFEIIVIDSSSSDGTDKIIMSKFLHVRLVKIKKEEFGHGKTRNLGASLAYGAYVAFLTQDAYPINDTWLFDLVTTLEHYPNAAGIFGRHQAKPDANPFTVRDINTHFESFSKLPIEVNLKTDYKKFGYSIESWQNILHFYSDNNSCLKKSIWQKIPYPEIDYGEDQVWADLIIKAGCSKLYSSSAVVAHSHNYNEKETEERAAIEAKFFKEYFNHNLIDKNISELEMDKLCESVNQRDIDWAKNHGVNKSVLSERLKLNKAQLIGFKKGLLSLKIA